MTTTTRNILPVSGLPGWGGPPDWFPASANHNYNLDDVHWFNAFKVTHGSGTNGAHFFRACYATIGGQKYIYLTLRAKFVPTMTDDLDLVLIGLRKKNSNKAMVFQIQVTPIQPANTPFSPAGPPSINPPRAVDRAAQVQYKTRTDTATNWPSSPVIPPTGWWIEGNCHIWKQNPDVDPTDENYRWAVQLRIPVQATGDITDSAGPNIGDDFEMWYLIQGSAAANVPLRIGEYFTIVGSPTTDQNVTGGVYPNPFELLPDPDPSVPPNTMIGRWYEFKLSSGPGSTDGVAINGTGYKDIVVRNQKYGEGLTVAVGTPTQPKENTFIVRPRNHRETQPPASGTIAAGNIGAFIRFANWGSGPYGPYDFNASTATWDYVPGNSPNNPKMSTSDIPVLPSPMANPTGDPIQLVVPNLLLGAGKSKHQCIYVNLTGTGLTFLNDSAFVNSFFEPGSLIEEEAEISVVGLEQVSEDGRTVYLATEKINLPPNTPPGMNEGKFLESTMTRLIGQGGLLAEKLLAAREMLTGVGDAGSAERLSQLLDILSGDLSNLKYNDPERGSGALRGFVAALSQWLTAVKQNDSAAKRLARLFEALASWLASSGLDRAAKLLAFINQLNSWLVSLNNDPASTKYLPAVVQAMRIWMSTLAEGTRLLRIVEMFENWLASGRSSANLPALIKALSDLLATINQMDPALRDAVESFSEGVARWLKGYERLQTFVNTLSKADLTEDEIDKLFPTLHVHVYHDTGERRTGKDGKIYPVLREQSSFGLHAYHEGVLDGWQTSIQGEGSQRVTENLYQLTVPNNGVKRVNIRIQAVEPGEERIPEDKIVPWDGSISDGGCLAALKKALGPLGFIVDFIAKLFGQKV